jgi:hypothetical protein
VRPARLALVAAAALALVSCPNPDPEPEPSGPERCDAGEQAFVARAMSLVWGRSSHGAAETRMWARASRDHGRDTVVRAMAGGPEYEARWRDWLMDALSVARRGDQAYSACFAEPLLEAPSGELVAYLRAAKPGSEPWGQPFNMADVLLSAIAADDLSVAYRTWLFARMNRPLQGANVPPDELERARRQEFGETFYATYLNRNLSCLPCHNSEFSTTGHPLPEFDRTWEVPGLFEASLFGDSAGLGEQTAYAMFRTGDLVRGADDPGIRPWGLDVACGVFAPGRFDDDPLGHEGYFIESLGPSGSVWQLEAWLRSGINQLEGDGRRLFEDDRMPGPQAFAWLVGASVVNQLWDEAFGSELVVSHDFPRNRAQRDRLEALTEEFVQGTWSLSELLVGVATDPYFNAAAPAGCAEAPPYGMKPVFEPWSISEDDEARQGNGPGDIVHRRSARVLMRSVHDAMGWPPVDPYPSGAVLQVQADLGAALRKSEPGFDGTDLGTLLTFEATYGTCEYPDEFTAACGPFESPGCNGCPCEACVCDIDSFCCDEVWDSLCLELCQDSCGGCQAAADLPPDFVARAIVDAVAQDRRVEDLVAALKDRITGDGAYTSEERLLIEGLLGTSLAARAADAPGIEGPLRAFCGALLISPDSFLVMDPGPAGEVPALAMDVDSDCTRLISRMAAVGVAVDCG